MGARWQDDRHAGLLEQRGEVGDLVDVVADDPLVGGLVNADRQRLHGGAGHAPVVREALVDHDELPQTLSERVVVDRDEPADRDEVILLRGEDRAVGEVGDQLHDLAQRVAPVAGLAPLHEERVLGAAGRVEDQRHAVVERDGAHLDEVLDRERLPAGHVQARLLADERDVLGPGGADDLLEPADVDVALPRVRRLRIGCLGDRDVRPDTARQLGMGARGREVEVRGDELARLDEHLREEVLGAAALVGRDRVLVAVHLEHGALEPEIAARAGVRLVAELHRGALLLRGRGGAAVGQQVDEDVDRVQKERVVAGLGERFAPRSASGRAIGSTTLILYGGACMGGSSRTAATRTSGRRPTAAAGKYGVREHVGCPRALVLRDRRERPRAPESDEPGEDPAARRATPPRAGVARARRRVRQGRAGGAARVDLRLPDRRGRALARVRRGRAPAGGRRRPRRPDRGDRRGRAGVSGRAGVGRRGALPRRELRVARARRHARRARAGGTAGRVRRRRRAVLAVVAAAGRRRRSRLRAAARDRRPLRGGGAFARDARRRLRGRLGHVQSLHWRALEEWLEANPADPDAPTIRDRHEHDRDEYLRFQRALLGWAIFAGRKPA